jgi:DNA-binding FadR family transcriptional regulator
LRRIIEPAAAGIAAERHTPETLKPIEQAYAEMVANKGNMQAGLEPDVRFHRSIVLATGNKLLVPMIYLIESALAETIKLTTQRPGAWENSIPLHHNVLRAIQIRDQAGATTAMLELLDSARSDMEHIFSSKAGEEA